MKFLEEDVQQSLKSYDPNSEPECFIHAYQKMIDKGVAEEIKSVLVIDTRKCEQRKISSLGVIIWAKDLPYISLSLTMKCI